MPLLDSFKIDHVKMEAPSLRVAKTLRTKEGSDITVYDLRIHKPNTVMMSERGIHTLEHLIAGFVRDNLVSTDWEVIDISPMGCRTGFYISIVGKPDLETLKEAIVWSMVDVINVESEDDIPELNVYQCGSYKMHSLEDAKGIAQIITNGYLRIYTGSELDLDMSLVK